ncbi:MAG: carbamoyltransferase HypF, partial [Candidatus Aminicenantes bacterium]|nr:carbamoyltransferase HypF [Candidatus Aminicenantes bacterium]
MTSSQHSAIDITVFGVVQGVGFRPFIYRLAKKLYYTGWVKNTGFGVKIHLEQKQEVDFLDFLDKLDTDRPPLSQIDEVSTSPSTFTGLKDFTIKKTTEGESFVFISPDISICDNCIREMKTPSNRRYQYPFINCTDCGPRYTIVKSLPYDRDQTTMHTFRMCKNCRKEYLDPLDRRYHAQPIACPVCGPQVELITTRTKKPVKDPISSAIQFVREGKILAVKG